MTGIKYSEWFSPKWRIPPTEVVILINLNRHKQHDGYGCIFQKFAIVGFSLTLFCQIVLATVKVELIDTNLEFEVWLPMHAPLVTHVHSLGAH